MKSFYYSGLTSDEMYTSATRIDKIISGSIINDPFITKVQPLLKASLIDLSLAHGRTTDPNAVMLLYEKDVNRDLRFIALRDFCKAYSVDLDAVMAKAGLTLVHIFKEQGWSMQLEGYAMESSLLQALIDRLEKEPGHSALTTIGGIAKFTDLKNAQIDFETTYKNKVDSKVREEYPKIRACRKLIVRYLGAMLSYIDMMAEIEKGSYSSCADNIDEVTTEFMAIVRNRQTRNKDEDTQGGQNSSDN